MENYHIYEKKNINTLTEALFLLRTLWKMCMNALIFSTLRIFFKQCSCVDKIQNFLLAECSRENHRKKKIHIFDKILNKSTAFVSIIFFFSYDNFPFLKNFLEYRKNIRFVCWVFLGKPEKQIQDFIIKAIKTLLSSVYLYFIFKWELSI